MHQDTNHVEMTRETVGTGTVSDLGGADKVIKYCLDNKIGKSAIDVILNRGYTSMEAFMLLDMEDLQTPKIPKGQRRLLIHIANSLTSPASTEPPPPPQVHQQTAFHGKPQHHLVRVFSMLGPINPGPGK